MGNAIQHLKYKKKKTLNVLAANVYALGEEQKTYYLHK